MVEVAVNQTIQQMANIKPAFPTGGICIADDVDGAAVGQQMIKLRLIREFVNPREVDEQQSPRVLSRSVETVEVHGLVAVVGAHRHKVSLLTHHVDQLELLEEGGDGIKAFANLWSRLDGDAQWGRVVEDETHECVADWPLAPVGHVEIQRRQMR